jgi:hypothetical protein
VIEVGKNRSFLGYQYLDLFVFNNLHQQAFFTRDRDPQEILLTDPDMGTFQSDPVGSHFVLDNFTVWKVGTGFRYRKIQKVALGTSTFEPRTVATLALAVRCSYHSATPHRAHG